MLYKIKFILVFFMFWGTTKIFCEPINILPLGNSITESAAGHNSYRRALYHKLKDAGYDVDFIGSMNRVYNNKMPPNPDFDLDHEGHWGWRIDEILRDLPGWLNNYTPDAALIHLGSNDAIQNQSLESTLEEFSGIFEALRTDNPDVVLFLALLIPIGREDLVADGDNDRLNAINAALPALRDEHSTVRSPIIIVDQNTGFNAIADTFDKIHPNNNGEEKMAKKWFDAFDSFYTGYESPSLTVTSPNGGEELKAGEQDTLKWSSTGGIDSVFLQYHSGEEWHTISGPVPDTGSYEWTVPDDVSNNIILRISTIDSSVSDTSDGAFSISAPLRLALPSGKGFIFSVAGQGIVYSGEYGNLHSVCIRELNGRQIIKLSAKAGSIAWDGRNKSRRLVSRGVYLAEILANGKSHSLKIFIH
ncbi:MAG: hypothetical protein HQK83_17025 [Fibrobacteria bacterium]|nr:hypothetical protein [Fibrobacteria bacterium]